MRLTYLPIKKAIPCLIRHSCKTIDLMMVIDRWTTTLATALDQIIEAKAVVCRGITRWTRIITIIIWTGMETAELSSSEETLTATWMPAVGMDINSSSNTTFSPISLSIPNTVEVSKAIITSTISIIDSTVETPGAANTITSISNTHNNTNTNISSNIASIQGAVARGREVRAAETHVGSRSDVATTKIFDQLLYERCKHHYVFSVLASVSHCPMSIALSSYMEYTNFLDFSRIRRLHFFPSTGRGEQALCTFFLSLIY